MDSVVRSFRLESDYCHRSRTSSDVQLHFCPGDAWE